MNDIAILSDVHGNYPALQSVLKDIDQRGIKTVYCLGDLVGYYCMINETVETVRHRRIQTVMGNHDHALVKNKGKLQASGTATAILQRQLEYISASNFEYLDTLPDSLSFKIGKLSGYGVHGGLKNRIDEYIKDINEKYFIFKMKEKD